LLFLTFFLIYKFLQLHCYKLYKADAFEMHIITIELQSGQA